MVEYIQASGLLPRTLAGSPATKWDRSMLEQDWNLPHFGLVKHWQLHHLYSIVLCHGLLLDKPGQKLFSCFTTPIWSIAAETNIWMNDLPDWNFCKLTMFTVCMYLTNIVIYIYIILPLRTYPFDQSIYSLQLSFGNLSRGPLVIKSNLFPTIKLQIPSRERSHVPPWEKEKHLQKCRLGGDMLVPRMVPFGSFWDDVTWHH